MDRDKQIALLAGAASRTNRHVADWMAEKDVKAAISCFHERIRAAKALLPKFTKA